MNSGIQKIISFFLLAIFFVAGTPDDLLHLLAHHHDTVDSNSATTSVSIKHIHCDALQLTLPAFSQSSSFHFAKQNVTTGQIFFAAETVTLQFFSLAPLGRAPPALA